MSPSPPSQASGWSDDRVNTLARLWREGLSASQIARQLGGVSRNAVIGKVHRLGLSGRAAPSAPRAISPRPARPRRPQRGLSARPPKASPPAAAPLAVAPEGPGLVDNLVHLSAHACKWPIGDPKGPGFSFCGRGCDGPYCQTHTALAVRSGTAWRPDRDPVVKRAIAGLL